MVARLFRSVTEEDKNKAIETLIHSSTPRPDFFLMIVLSVIVATFGLTLNSASIIIGSMLIAPILSPVLSISLGLVMSDYKLISRSLATISRSALYAVVAAFSVAVLFYTDGAGQEIIGRAVPSLPYFLVAVVAGFAVAFALVKPSLNALLPGVAIAVALIPPLAATGVGLANFDLPVALNAFTLFALNVFGIVVASLIVFSMMNLYVKRVIAKEAEVWEDSVVKQEEIEEKTTNAD